MHTYNTTFLTELFRCLYQLILNQKVKYMGINTAWSDSRHFSNPRAKVVSSSSSTHASLTRSLFPRPSALPRNGGDLGTAEVNLVPRLRIFQKIWWCHFRSSTFVQLRLHNLDCYKWSNSAVSINAYFWVSLPRVDFQETWIMVPCAKFQLY